MENRKAYHAPSAQIVLLAPGEELTVSFGKGSSWWGNNSAWWGSKPAQGASLVTGTLLVDDEDGKSWEWNP